MERKSNNYQSVILYETTIKEEGFDPREVGWQKKHIWSICRYCGKSHRVYGANYSKNKTDYHQLGSACHKECRIKEQSESGSPFLNPAIKLKAQENKTKNISQKEINHRISEGRRKAQSQIEQTNLDKYGVKNPFQSEDIKAKIVATNLKKYGVEHPMQNTNIANKAAASFSETFLENGVEISNKRKKTCLKKYGVTNIQKSDKIKEKTRQSFNKTILTDERERYKQINILRGAQFWVKMENGATLLELCAEYSLNYGSLTGRLLDDEFIHRYYSSYSFPTQQKQMQIVDLLRAWGLDVSVNNRSIIDAELDCYIHSKQFAIEFNGSYWHSEACLNRTEAIYKHRNKTNMCREKGITLFHLFENIWDRRQVQVLSFIRSALGLNTERVMARKCEITEDMGHQLLDNYHIQGFGHKTLKSFDLVYNKEVIGSMSAAKHHRINNDSVVVLNRMTFKENTTIAGGASKLFNTFNLWAKKTGFKRIITWSDSCWTEGKIYERLGFNMSEESRPNYFYWDMANNRYVSKQTKKDIGLNGLALRKWENENKLYRIWDCGKKRWEYIL